MGQNSLHELFLTDDPTLEQRWQALSLNMQVWFERRAQACDGEVVREEGMHWTYSPMEESNITISSLDALKEGELIDRMLAWYRQRHPLHGGLCWYLAAPPAGDLAARLFARGFEPNWQPHWMWLELRHMNRSDVCSATFDIRIVEDGSIGEDKAVGIVGSGASPDPTIPTFDDLPFYSAEEAAVVATLHHIYPRHIWHLAAFQGQQPVGRCVLNVTDGKWGVAGLFNMAVVPPARKQGIGTALVRAACELAERIGCRHVVLNATDMGTPVYRRVGFQSMGYGHSWCFRERMLVAPAATKERVMLLEAIGRGDMSTLNEMSNAAAGMVGVDAERMVGGDIVGSEASPDPTISPPTIFSAASPSGLTALDIAVRCQQPASATWLIEHGAQLDLISAWELGWKERIPEMLAEQPELVNVQRGDWQLTPLHVAVERNDIELAKQLLTVPNDLSIKDTQFHATALGWAQFFQRAEMVALIEQHRGKQ